MSTKKVVPYIECPERICFRCHSSSTLAPEWFSEALSMESLRKTFDGSIRTLCKKGKFAEVYIRTVKDPIRLSDVKFYLSEHNNYHVGISPQEEPDWRNLSKYNPSGYVYFQDDRFFLAIKKLYENQGKEHYLMCITKKMSHKGSARAQQD